MVTAEVVALASSPLSRWSRRPSRQRGRPLSIEEKDLLFCARVGRRPLLLPSCLPTYARGLSQWKRKNLRASEAGCLSSSCLSSRAAASADAPGCAAEGARGAGDVPGADYCHAAVRVDTMTQVPQRPSSVRWWCCPPATAAGPSAGPVRRRTPSNPGQLRLLMGGVHSRRNRCRRGRLQPRGLRHREDGADGSALVHGRDGVRPQRVRLPAVHGGAVLPRQRRRRRRRGRGGGAGGDRAARGAGGWGGRLVYQSIHTWRRGSAEAARARGSLRHVPGGGTPRRRDRR